jgi:hypothetical protein
VGIRVREWSKTVIVFLASGIPQCEFHVLSVNLDIGDVVFKNSGDVDLCKEDSQPLCKAIRRCDSDGLGMNQADVDQRMQRGWAAVEDSLRETSPSRRHCREQQSQRAARRRVEIRQIDLHEQAGLSAGSITHDDELSTDLGHGCWRCRSGKDFVGT